MTQAGALSAVQRNGMITVNLHNINSLILNDLDRHPVMAQFLEGVLLAGGVEVKWESDFTFDPHGTLQLEGRRYVGARWVGQCVERPLSQEAMT